MRLQQLAELFERHADDHKARQMQAYMKHKFVFHGIQTPQRKQLSQPLVRDARYKDESALYELCHSLWALPQREYQYVGLDLLIRNKKTLSPRHIKQLQQCIVSKSWWDTVDMLASHCVGQLVAGYPKQGAKTISRWRRANNLWLRRTCLLFQLKYQQQTDAGLLAEVILENRGDPEFFIQKAIGWSLREYAKFDPAWVKGFVERHSITGLARREALKHQ